MNDKKTNFSLPKVEVGSVDALDNLKKATTDIADKVNPKKKIWIKILTFVWLFWLIKTILKLIWKMLTWIVAYIHDLTDPLKFMAVMFYTFVGVVIGVGGTVWLIMNISPEVKEILLDRWQDFLSWFSQLFV